VTPSFLHTGHTLLSVFPLIPFNLQIPIFHHRMPLFPTKVQMSMYVSYVE
jgi:hypothetical protein